MLDQLYRDSSRMVCALRYMTRLNFPTSDMCHIACYTNTWEGRPLLVYTSHGRLVITLFAKPKLNLTSYN